RRGVGAEPDVKRVAERKLPGEAHQHVPGDAGVGEIEDDDQHRQQVVVGEQGRCNQADQHEAEQRERMAGDAAEKERPHPAFLPMRPCGRNSSTSTRMAKANMLLADGVKNSPAIASVSPISTPPSSAPGMEPSPPVMTMTKASSVKAGPSAGVTSTNSTSIPPAAPTQAAPRPNVRP